MQLLLYTHKVAYIGGIYLETKQQQSCSQQLPLTRQTHKFSLTVSKVAVVLPNIISVQICV